MEYQNLRFEVQDGCATITVSREKVLNALDARTLDELEDAIGRVEDEAGVKGAIIIGAGEKAFVAGADIQALAECRDPRQATATAERGQRLTRKIEVCSKPVIACVNGFALGGGLELALACHFRYASKNAKVGLPEVKLGLIPGYGGTQRLPREVGRGRALELILTGEPIDAEEALKIGLVNKVLETRDQLLEAARKTIGAIASRGPVAVKTAIRVVDMGLEVGIERGLAVEAAAFGAIGVSEDAKEGTRAFLEKRPAKFAGGGGAGAAGDGPPRSGGERGEKIGDKK
jgi:enoyl-CoA hydratase